MIKPNLVLASQSKARRQMLEAAGVTLTAQAPDVDEEALRREFRADGRTVHKLAEALAEAKALALSHRTDSKLILGGDQLLLCEDGTMLDKPVDQDDAKTHLQKLSGKKHKLISAAVIAEQGEAIWRNLDMATLTMRDLGDDFVDHYVETEWKDIRHCVGCYEIEGRGAQLFSAIEGSYFTIMGMPLLQVLDFLRIRGVLET